MSEMSEASQVEEQSPDRLLIMAAGGIVERGRGPELRIALVQRQRYHNDLSLPKGKQDPGESLPATALREVYEETGCRVRLGDFAGCVQYFVGGTPKVVLYWKMQPLGDPDAFQPSGEVQQLHWLPPAEALAQLTYEDEKELLRRVYDLT
ncbi:NUDIX hydrolase [Desulfurivibrio alkaliphilus]|uniref:NUDIX hydrolase n=1 Tax=Desulfurivibrio alkaliphilus (strain DSM 19089 / UNIQEM U267 / AHT2) TaxID=589865 RepID=D6Z2B3_DESAT|nr:NUDIX hydrolase [Desulfurivibrio alkaliphilus]ADH85688.1 NUDIX hydrolase [Desulfurivibrio alkaliphilus AHT 2]